MTSRQRTRVGVVGVGAWGSQHARVYALHPQARLIAVVSPEFEAALRVGRTHGVPAFAHHRDLIGRVDAASVAAPARAHFEIARDLLDAGIHVLVEKPIATRPEEARELIALARRRGCVLAVGHIERFKPSVEALLELAPEPLAVQVRRCGPPQPGRSRDTGVVLDLMIHDLELLLALGRSPLVEARGLGASLQGPGEDLALVHARLESGCRASLVASRISACKSAQIEVFTADGTLELDLRAQRLTLRREERTETLDYPSREPLELELEHFLACVRGESVPRVDGEQGLAALEAALAVLAGLAT